MLRRAAYLAGTLAIASACSLLFSVDGYEGVRDGGAEVHAQDSGTADVAADVPDSGCPDHPMAIVCDDFDHGPFGAKWDATTDAQNAILSLSDAQWVSPPFSLLSMVDNDGAAGASASLAAFVPNVPPKLRVSYDVLFAELALHSAEVGSVYLNYPGSMQYTVNLHASPNSTTMSILESGTFIDGGMFHSFSAIPLNQWARVILDLDFVANTLTLALEQPPGTQAATILTPSPISPMPGATTMTLVAGLDYIKTPSSVTVYVDNVVIETE